MTLEDNKKLICHLIAALDRKISSQINVILHDTRFQALESLWRGLSYLLADGVSAKTNVKIKILAISWHELTRDLNRAVEFDQSHLFQKIYSNEFGSAGGEPFGLLLADFKVPHSDNIFALNQTLATLRNLSKIAAAAFAPIVLGADPSLFKLNNFSEFSKISNVDEIFQQPEYASWRQFRQEEDSRFLAIVMPDVLMRKPYAKYETIDQQNDYLWGNAIFCFASICIRAFINYGWFAHIQGVNEIDEDHGGKLNNLPRMSFATDDASLSAKPSVNITFTNDQEKQLAELGFIVLSENKFDLSNAFYTMPSLQTNTKNKIACLMPYLLCASRFAHYLKAIARDKIGLFVHTEACQSYLQAWLQQYTAADQDVGFAVKAKYPLRSAQITVAELAGDSSKFNCLMQLSPHYQFDTIESQLFLSTDLSKAG